MIIGIGDPDRFDDLGELVYEIYHTIHVYNTTRIHTVLKMSPREFAKKTQSSRIQLIGLLFVLRKGYLTMAVTEIKPMISKPYTKESFKKTSLAELRKILTPLQYQVTQEEGTERPFGNEYDKNTASGLYVDIVSGELLFSSKDKYDSGTGWPSFVKPISANAVIEKESTGVFGTRIEIRSRIADSHLGHVFDDGPQDRGGKRYCMNSAAMKFIPKADMDKLGYGEYIQFIE